MLIAGCTRSKTDLDLTTQKASSTRLDSTTMLMDSPTTLMDSTRTLMMDSTTCCKCSLSCILYDVNICQQMYYLFVSDYLLLCGFILIYLLKSGLFSFCYTYSSGSCPVLQLLFSFFCLTEYCLLFIAFVKFIKKLFCLWPLLSGFILIYLLKSGLFSFCYIYQEVVLCSSCFSLLFCLTEYCLLLLLNLLRSCSATEF